MATTRLTQTQLVKALAAHGQVTNKVAKDIQASPRFVDQNMSFAHFSGHLSAGIR